MGNKAFALTGRLADCCLYPGRCPGLGASALSGRAGRTYKTGRAGQTYKTGRAGRTYKTGRAGRTYKTGLRGELAKLDKHLNIYL